MSILVLSMGFSQAMTMPVRQDVILTFGHSNEVEQAVSTILNLNPSAIKVDITSPMLNLILTKSVGALFIVGHGYDQGIITNNKVYSWESIVSMAEVSSLSKVYFVSCNSYSASISIKDKPTLGFDGAIEPVLGAQLAMLSLAFIRGESFISMARNVMKRLVEVTTNPEKFSTLGYFSHEEAMMNSVFIVLAIFGLIFSAFSFWANKIEEGSKTTLIRVAEGADAINSVLQAVVTLITTGQFAFSVISDLTIGAIPLLGSLIGTLSFWDQLAAWASLGVDLIAYFSPATIWNVISILLASVIFALTLAIAVCDYNDWDGTFGNC